MANSSCVIVNIRETFRCYLGYVLPVSGGSILECVIPQNLAENTHEQEVAGWLRVQTVLVAAPDHKNSPHYRLEIKCEGRGRESWTGLIVLENIFLIRGILWSIVCWCCAATWY